MKWALNYGDGRLTQGEANTIKQQSEKNIRLDSMRHPAFILRDYSAWYQENHTPETIHRVQKALKVPETGALNLETLQAIIDYQKRTHLGQDGLLGKPHIERLLQHESEISAVQSQTQAELTRLSQEAERNPEMQNIGKIRRFHGRLKGLSEGIEVLVEQYQDVDTMAIGMDVAMQGINWALRRNSETPAQMLIRMHGEYRLKARALANDIGNEMRQNHSFTSEQRQTLETYKQELEGLAQSRLSVNPLKIFLNNVKNIPEYATSAAYGTVGVIEWGANALKDFVVSIFDLTALLFRYSFGGSEARAKIHQQANELWEVVKNVDKKMLEAAIKQASDHYNSLPPEKQSQFIGNIGGYIIGILIPMGAFARGSKAEQLARARALALPQSTMAQLQYRGLQAALFTANWPLESLIGVTAVRALRGSMNIIRSTSNVDLKVREFDKAIAVVDSEMKAANITPEKREALENIRNELIKQKDEIDTRGKREGGENTDISEAPKDTHQSNDTTPTKYSYNPDDYPDHFHIRDTMKTGEFQKISSLEDMIRFLQSKDLPKWEDGENIIEHIAHCLSGKTHRLHPDFRDHIYHILKTSDAQTTTIQANTLEEFYEKMRASLLLTVSTNGKSITIPIGSPYQNAHSTTFLESSLDNPEWKVLFEFYQKHPDIHIVNLVKLFSTRRMPLWFNQQITEHKYLNIIEKLYTHYNHGKSDWPLLSINDAFRWEELKIGTEITTLSNNPAHTHHFLKFLEHAQYDIHSRYGKSPIQEIYDNYIALYNSGVHPDTFRTYLTLSKQEHINLYPDEILQIIKHTPGDKNNRAVIEAQIDKVNASPRYLYNSPSFHLLQENTEDARQLLWNIRSSENPRQALQDFKNLMHSQQMHISDIMIEAKKMLNDNPEITFDDFISQAIKNPEKLSQAQKIALIQGMKEYHTKVQTIERLLQTHKENPHALLEEVYPHGHWLEHPISVERRDSALVFYISHPDDYRKVLVWNNPQSTGGFKTNESYIPELKWSLTFVNWDRSRYGAHDTAVHEARHADNHIIFSKNTDFIGITQYDKALIRGKDEIIAYITDGESNISTIQTRLLREDGDYNYFKDTDLYKNGDKTEWNRYVQEIHTALDIAPKIIDRYGKERAIELMAITDIRHWRRYLDESVGTQNTVSLPEKYTGLATLRDYVRHHYADALQDGKKVLIATGVTGSIYASHHGGDILFEDENARPITTDEQLSSLNVHTEQTSNEAGDHTSPSDQDANHTINTVTENASHLHNPLRNHSFLRQMMGDAVTDIAHPSREELIAILENAHTRQQEGNALIYAIQSALSLLGYGEHLGNIDGYMGSKTVKALKNFQEHINTSASDSGKIGSSTLDGLINALKNA